MEGTTKIVEVLNLLCEKFGVAADWSQENIVPYAQELAKKIINYELWTSVFLILIFLILSFISFFTAWRLTKTKGFSWDDEEIITGITISFVILGIFSSFVTIVMIPIQVFDIITCFTFPEKIILNTIQNLM